MIVVIVKVVNLILHDFELIALRGPLRTGGLGVRLLVLPQFGINGSHLCSLLHCSLAIILTALLVMLAFLDVSVNVLRHLRIFAMIPVDASLFL